MITGADEARRRVTSTCGLCSLTCGLELQVTGQHLAEVRLAQGFQHRCPLAAKGPSALQRAARLDRPLVRMPSRLEEVDWPTAISTASHRLAQCLLHHGPNSVAIMSSGSLPLEASWLIHQIALDGLHTTQLASQAHTLLRGARTDLDPLLGRTASTCCRQDLDAADLVVVVGADPARTHPGMACHLARAARRGAHLAVLHSSYTDLTREAATWIDPRRGTLCTLLAGLLAHVRGSSGRSASLPPALTQTIEAALEGFDLASVCAITGTEVCELTSLAERLCRAERVIAVYDLGDSTERSQGDLALLACMLASLGQLRAGCGLMLLQAEADDTGIAMAELHHDLGDCLGDGGIRSLVVVGEDPLANPELEKRLVDLDTLVVLDAHASATSLAADVTLPIPTLAESDGTLVACDGRVCALERSLDPAAGWDLYRVLAALGEALDVHSLPHDACTIRAEISLELGMDAGFLEGLRDSCGLWTWPVRIRDGAADASPRPGATPAEQQPWPRPQALVDAQQQLPLVERAS